LQLRAEIVGKFTLSELWRSAPGGPDSIGSGHWQITAGEMAGFIHAGAGGMPDDIEWLLDVATWECGKEGGLWC
jgi:hypothetical protein